MLYSVRFKEPSGRCVAFGFLDWPAASPAPRLGMDVPLKVRPGKLAHLLDECEVLFSPLPGVEEQEIAPMDLGVAYVFASNSRCHCTAWPSGHGNSESGDSQRPSMRMIQPRLRR